MATRLKADESGESKWADIDDDEDDWAPETVEWVDGTKSNVAAHATPTPPVEEKKLAGSPAPEMAPSPRVLAGAVQPPTAMPSTKTILKPGIHASTQSRSPGLGGKSPADKPALVAKSPAQPPVKSPWAPLPPIDRVTPVFPNPPHASNQAPFRRDPHGFDSLPPPPGPTREIAADDFNRSWRDDRGPRERALFNSRSGGYEPVGEMRRGSMREEHGYRQPAVLQRPLHSDKAAPAEPSPAFQTNRSSAESSSWSRRRTSSNLSSVGGRRPSFSRPFDGADGISPTGGAILDSPQQVSASMDRSVHPGGAGQREWTRGSPIQYQQPSVVGSDTLPNGDAPAGEPYEDPVARQQRLMREKLAAARLAKQREQEEEKREEAARKERLKAKLEALAAQTPSPELKEPRPKEGAQSAPRSPQPPKPMPMISPPKPPVPTAEGEVAQYGMMKVHQPHPVKRSVVSEASLISKTIPEPTTETRQSANAVAVARPAQPVSQPAVSASGTIPGASGGQGPDASARRVQREQPNDAHAWRPSATPAAAAYNWSSNTSSSYSSSGNVWGPPQSRERGLGNGTFDNFNTAPAIQGADNSSTIGQPPIVPSTDHDAAPHFKNSSLPRSEPSLSQTSQHLPPSIQNSANQQFQLPSASKIPPTLFSSDSSSSIPSSSIKMGLAPATPTEGSFPDLSAGPPASSQSVLSGPIISGPGMKPIFGGQRGSWAQWDQTLREADNARPKKEWGGFKAAGFEFNMDGVTITHDTAGTIINDKKRHKIEEAESAARIAADAAASAEVKTSSWVPPHLRDYPKRPAGAAPETNIRTWVHPQVRAQQRREEKRAAEAVATAKAVAQEENKVDAVAPPVRKSKFQGLFEGQRGDASTPAPVVAATINTATMATDIYSVGSEAAHLTPLDDCPPPDYSLLFTAETSRIKVKLPVRPVVNLPKATQYKHIQATSTTTNKSAHIALPAKLPTAQTSIEKIHALWNNKAAPVADHGVSTITKQALDIETHRAVVSVPNPGVPKATSAAVSTGPGTKPDGDDLFEEPQFASRPPVRVPKAQPVNAHLPATPIDFGRINSRYAVTDAQSQTPLDVAPVVKSGSTTVVIKTPGATESKSLTMRTQGRPRPQQGGYNKPSFQRGNSRRNFSGRNGLNGPNGNGGPNNTNNSPKPRGNFNGGNKSSGSWHKGPNNNTGNGFKRAPSGAAAASN
jgi:hypothetical protein